jgi:hypothetical protein
MRPTQNSSRARHRDFGPCAATGPRYRDARSAEGCQQVGHHEHGASGAKPAGEARAASHLHVGRLPAWRHRPMMATRNGPPNGRWRRRGNATPIRPARHRQPAARSGAFAPAVISLRPRFGREFGQQALRLAVSSQHPLKTVVQRCDDVRSLFEAAEQHRCRLDGG